MLAWLCASIVASVPSTPLAAQEAEAPLERNQLTIDAYALGGGIGYARRMGPRTLTGGQIDIGGHFIERMLIAGKHFSEEESETVFEMVGLTAFARHEPTPRWQIDLGLRVSAFLHFDETDDDPGGGLFYGAYASAFWGWRHVRFGPRLLIGVFDEQVDSEFEAPREFGVHLAPLAVRAVVPW